MTHQEEARLPAWVRWLPVGLLVAVALHQQYLVHTQDLTAWKGGGFGMFSTVDELHRRMVFAYLLTEAGEVAVPLDSHQDAFGRLYWRTAALPHGDHAGRLAREVARRDWFTVVDDALPESPAIAVPAGQAPGDAPPVVFDAVRLEVWRLQFDSADSQLSRRLLAALEVEVPR